MDPDSFDAFLFHPDFGNQMTARDFCETFVEPTGKEAGEVLVTPSCELEAQRPCRPCADDGSVACSTTQREGCVP